MAKNKKEKTAEERAEAIKKITPEMIVMDDDSDMPKPETKQYKVYLKLTPKFMQLFGQCVNSLPYRTVLTNTQGKQMALPKLVQFIEQHREKIGREDMNFILSFLDNLAFVHARPLMDAVSGGAQQELWEAFEG